MMNKKGISNTMSIVIGALILLGVIGLIIVLIFALGGEKTKITPIDEGVLNVYLNSVDSETLKQLKSNFIITNERGERIAEGKLDENSLTEKKDIPEGGKINIYCWDGNHYLSSQKVEFSAIEKFSNASKQTCTMNPFGKLEITHEGDLINQNTILKINITANGYFNKMSAVISWTQGIINVKYDIPSRTCEGDLNWINFSYYNPEEEEYTYLAENHYFCGEQLEICEKINEKFCKLKEEEIPERFKGKVDSVIYIAESLKDNSYILILNIKTEEEKISTDYIEITFYDKDLRIIGDGQLKYFSELDGEDIGAKDFTYRISYEA